MGIKLGIVGYGGMANWHHKNSVRVPGMEVVGAFDIDPEAQANAKKNGIIAFDSREALLKDPNINLVLVATPNDVHCEIAVAAIKAGKNVISEKPVAMNIRQVDEMIETSLKEKVLFTVHQNRRWDKDYLTMRNVVEKGLIGTPYTIESRVHGTGGLMHGWRGYAKHGGGMLLDWGVHMLDQILFMYPTGLKTVFAQLRNIKNPQDPTIDDYAKVVLTFESGLSATMEVATFTMRQMPRWFVCGDVGAVVIEDFGAERGGITRMLSLKETFEKEIQETAAGPTRTMAPLPEETKEDLALPDVPAEWSELYKNVGAAIDGKAELIVKPVEVRRVFRVMEEAMLSSAKDISVAFDEKG